MKPGDVEVKISVKTEDGLKITGTYLILACNFDSKMPQKTLVQVIAKGIEQMWTAQKAMSPVLEKKKRKKNHTPRDSFNP